MRAGSTASKPNGLLAGAVRTVIAPARALTQPARAIAVPVGVARSAVRFAGRKAGMLEPDGTGPVPDHSDSRTSPRLAPRPTESADLRRQAIALGADVLAAGFAIVGDLAHIARLPVETFAPLAAVDASEAARSRLEGWLGQPSTDLGLASASAVAAGLSHGISGVATDFVHRSLLVAELLASRDVWRSREAELCASPGQHGEATVRPRPAPLPKGPVECCAERLTAASAAGAGLTVAATHSPRRSAQLLLAGLPKAGRLAREAFASQLTRLLAQRGTVVMDSRALRRLDRIDTVVVDAAALEVGGRTLGQIEPLGDLGAAELVSRLYGLFDPDRPAAVQHTDGWVLEPVAPQRTGDVSLPRGAPTRIRRLARGKTLVLGLLRGDDLVGLVPLAPRVDPGVAALMDAIGAAGHRLLVAGRPHPATGVVPDAVIPGGRRLAGAIRKLQKEGRVVAVISAKADDALAASDCGVGLVRSGEAVPWGAHLLCGPHLTDAAVIVAATEAARMTSRQATRISMASSAVGGTLALTEPERRAHSGRRALRLVNEGALAAMALGVWSASRLGLEPPEARGDSTPWHAMPVEAVLRALESTASGLKDADVAARRRPEYDVVPAGGLGRAMLEELDNPFTPVLAGSAALAATTSSGVDAGLVASVMTAGALLGGIQRRQAEGNIARLRFEQAVPALVCRDAQPVQVTAAELVPGDLVTLRAGDAVPADCRIVSAHALEVDESSVTGESLPVIKTADATAAATVAERSCMLYESTTVAAGRATAVVVATGGETEAGRSRAAALARRPASGVEERLTALTSRTLQAASASAGILTASGLVRGRRLPEILNTAVTLAVAAVPEGLPMLATTAQLAAARRLSQRGTLVREPRTIEALGRVDTLCVDKTGTLTEGRIRLRRIADADADEPVEAATGGRLAVLAAALRATPPGALEALPHATDRAIVRAGLELGLPSSSEGWERVDELPFEPARGFHAVLSTRPGSGLLSVKGAPEVVLPLCDDQRVASAPKSLTPSDRVALGQRVEGWARDGFRVLAVAQRHTNPCSQVSMSHLHGLTLLGFLALADPVRATAAKAVREVQQARVRVVMLTGDHPSTAEAIAVELGILDAGRVLTGSQLDAMTDADLAAALPQTTVYARVTPAQKVRIIGALRTAGGVVAMTGDGANDAPAIRQADVGVAMGGSRSTSAARLAGDVVVTDDRIESLIDAMVEGRAMWRGVRDGLAILVGGNLGEIAYTLLGSALSRHDPINSRQLLLVNLLTDLAPATALALQPPRVHHPDRLLLEGPEVALGAALTNDMLVRGVVTAAAATGAWCAARVTGRPARAQTVGLVALVGAQLGQTLVAGGRSPRVTAAGLTSAAALAGVVQTPVASRFFGCTPLGPVGWAIAGGAAAAATGAAVVIPRFGLPPPFSAPAPDLASRRQSQIARAVRL